MEAACPKSVRTRGRFSVLMACSERAAVGFGCSVLHVRPDSQRVSRLSLAQAAPPQDCAWFSKLAPELILSCWMLGRRPLATRLKKLLGELKCDGFFTRKIGSRHVSIEAKKG